MASMTKEEGVQLLEKSKEQLDKAKTWQQASDPPTGWHIPRL